MKTSSRCPLHVLVVDDSAVVRQALITVLSSDPLISVAVAGDPLIAQEKMRRRRPDVIVLDLLMPRMDGLTFLTWLMAADPIPVVICSEVAGQGTAAALQALEAGALEVVAKPRLGVQDFLHESGLILIDAVRAAAQARRPLRGEASRPPSPAPVAPGLPAPLGSRLVAIGASTGGTEALKVVLEALPPGAPPVVVVQHMPEGFTAAFAARLNQACQIEVKEAEDGDAVLPGRAIIARGNHHLRVVRAGAGYRVRLSSTELVSRHRPSVDVLFDSVAQVAGSRALGILMTGMGDDGAEGLLAMKRAGAETIAQDERSCVVFGMPKEAIARGAVDAVVPLGSIARMILRAHVREGRWEEG